MHFRPNLFRIGPARIVKDAAGRHICNTTRYVANIWLYWSSNLPELCECSWNNNVGNEPEYMDLGRARAHPCSAPSHHPGHSPAVSLLVTFVRECPFVMLYVNPLCKICRVQVLSKNVKMGVTTRRISISALSPRRKNQSMRSQHGTRRGIPPWPGFAPPSSRCETSLSSCVSRKFVKT